ncbi:MAG TPA: SusC/RagA family TonB-linked outer membrane protein [Dinghuibacter sp.]|uniref:SusC/RagA family TonB-linked outer membrane protein n=1 Tax=Dinghuibacter sp. TaxID=2024697 RepID=UPI002BEFE290|nr:SusC/RagA family TonB-linked outer membrane protein [Dinghuibacter sp.]HTJ13460.1 SusC/RagA family TonB-linked outer membrane protein [Dinghuibacter sp.]
MKKRLLVLMAILLWCLRMQAQERTTSGQVTDANNHALAGVTVTVKGRNVGTSTNENGNFTLKTAPGDVLVFTSIGYTALEQKATGNMSVTLQSLTASLGDVVVVGYGTQRQKEITGSTVAIKAENLPKTASTSINNLLQGQAAGLNVDQRTAQPGGGLNINIRGQGYPLYVIDGVPLFNNQAAEPAITSGGSSNELGFSGGIDRDPLENINPNDIESIEILKDASATAIYGSAAANGVILITTKRAKTNGVVTTEYQGGYTLQTAKPYYHLLNATDFEKQVNALNYDQYLYNNKMGPYGSNTSGPTFNPVFSQAQIDTAGSGTDWLKMLMRHGSIDQHNLSVTYGNDMTRVFTSFNYYNNQALLKNSNFVRYTGRANIEQKLNSWVKLGVDVTFSQINSNNASSGAGGQGEKYNALQAAYAYSPAVGVYDDAGNFTHTLNTEIMNPAAFLTIADKLQTGRVLAAPSLDIKILDNLKVDLVGGIDKTSSNRQFFLPSKAQNFLYPTGLAQLSTQSIQNYSAEGYATYNKSFGDHNFSLVGGGGYYKSFNTSTSMQGVGFFTDALGYNDIGLGTNVAQNYEQSYHSPDLVKISQFLRLNYSYKSKYILTINSRRDGSSDFAVNKKYGIFGGASGAWRISQESFLSHSKVVSELKLRAGYGTVGDDAGLNALSLYSTDGGSFLIGSGNAATFYPSVSVSQLANPNLTWETIRSTNLGLDYGLFNNRITGTVDLFRNDRIHLLNSVPLPANNAVSYLNVNIGSQRSQGVEFSITSKNIVSRTFRWETSFNISNYVNRWLSRDPYVQLEPYQKVNDRTDEVYGWKTAGIIKSAGDVPNYMPNATVGNIIYQDINGDKTLDSKDVVKLGHSAPAWSFGLTNRFNYGNFDLSVFLYGKLGMYLQSDYAANGFYLAGRMATTSAQNSVQGIKNVWTAANPNGIYPGVAQNPYDGNNPSGVNNFFYQNVNYLRFSNIMLGYTLHARKVIQAARIYAGVQNLGIWTNYKGYDPELAAQGTPNPYPQALSSTIGIDVTF